MEKKFDKFDYENLINQVPVIVFIFFSLFLFPRFSNYFFEMLIKQVQEKNAKSSNINYEKKKKN